MGQQADNGGRQAQLDQQKQRSAGRQGRTGQESPTRKAILDAQSALPMKGETGGAFGPAAGKVRDSAPVKADYLSTGRSTRPARKRGR
jgi:hypothetical protein